MITLRNLEKSIDSAAGRMFLLRRIDMEIRQGEFVTIMGPSGAGKSTL
ncbi:MAG: ATP-binding cassette domain-containing protein, partial [Gemmatimonadetes bacterium]|nr:ATP-binding cassette domain-containing protein [Gemmatimonadota bacterium]